MTDGQSCRALSCDVFFRCPFNFGKLDKIVRMMITVRELVYVAVKMV